MSDVKEEIVNILPDPKTALVVELLQSDAEAAIDVALRELNIKGNYITIEALREGVSAEIRKQFSLGVNHA